MIKAADLPQTLAVFPLPGALLLPRSRLPLHIFEPRYLQMIEDALKSGTRLIGMIQPNPMRGKKDALHHIGCAGKITQFSETEDGRFLITLSGASRFRIVEEITGFSPYRKCNVIWDGFDRDLGPEEVDKGFNRHSLMLLLERYFSARGLSTDWDTLKDADDELLINSLSMLLDFKPEDKQALLEAPSLTTRRETLVTLIEFALRGGNSEEMMQ
ncbi:MAG: LON peptidase substrate-binding domain-containing protein [Aestuariivita sp.]|uniref:LON peptidase substrate-binding domain-containing protein n=1 Tax=Aestuariivita sp. TaxID=1872407 RepID=UPI003BB179D4